MILTFDKYKNLRELGYTTLFANSFGTFSGPILKVEIKRQFLSDEALEQYRVFPDLVKVGDHSYLFAHSFDINLGGYSK